MVLRVRRIAAADHARPRIHRVTNNGHLLAETARNLKDASYLVVAPNAIRLDLAAPVSIDLRSEAMNERITRWAILMDAIEMVRMDVFVQDLP